MPALVVELKWDKPVKSAISQIGKTNYLYPLEGLDVLALPVGITHNSKATEHDCAIDEWVR